MPVLRALNEEVGKLGLSVVLMLPQTVIMNMLLYSQYPASLLCNLQGVKNVFKSVFMSWILYLGMFWE